MLRHNFIATLLLVLCGIALVGSPAQARFLQVDPVGYKDDVNWYTYVQNDPTNKTDPSGLSFAGDDESAMVIEQAQRDSMQQAPGLTLATTAAAVAIPVAIACAAGGCAAVGTAIGARIAAASPSTAVAIPSIANAFMEGNPASSGAATEVRATVGGNFTQAQKAGFYSQNMAKNGGELRSDLSGQLLVPSEKSVKGVTPPSNAATVDHWISKSMGGDNGSGNAAILGRAENIQKSNKIPTSPCPGGYTNCKR